VKPALSFLFLMLYPAASGNLPDLCRSYAPFGANKPPDAATYSSPLPEPSSLFPPARRVVMQAIEPLCANFSFEPATPEAQMKLSPNPAHSRFLGSPSNVHASLYLSNRSSPSFLHPNG